MNRLAFAKEFVPEYIQSKSGATVAEIARVLHRDYTSEWPTFDSARSVVRRVLGTHNKRIHHQPIQTILPPIGESTPLERPTYGHISLEIYGTDWKSFGLVSDTHLGSLFAREDALHSVYDVFESEGITRVFHAGNMIDGYIPRINGYEVSCTTVDAQTQYVIDHYPRRKGITTYFITGDDHESWFMKDGFNWGKHLQLTAQSQGRDDLVYIGHLESDVEIKGEGGSAIIKIQHPGGGSAYARSYASQKFIESLEGGEKPAILIRGHMHVSNFMNERNVYVVDLPGLQDQTIFARKRKLRMEVGGSILQFKQSPVDGSILRCKVEFIRFFNRGYYKRWLGSDTQSKENHLVFT
jgi:hypothetical protein